MRIVALFVFIFFLLFVPGQMWRKRTWCGGQVRKAVVGQLGLEFLPSTFSTRARLGLRSLATHQEVQVENFSAFLKMQSLLTVKKKKN